MFYLCVFKKVQNDLIIYYYYNSFCWFRLALQINRNASLFISYDSCKFDRH